MLFYVVVVIVSTSRVENYRTLLVWKNIEVEKHVLIYRQQIPPARTSDAPGALRVKEVQVDSLFIHIAKTLFT